MSLSQGMACNWMDLLVKGTVVVAVAAAVAPSAVEAAGWCTEGSSWSARVRHVSQSPAPIDQNSAGVRGGRARCDREVWSRIRLSEGRKEFLATSVSRGRRRGGSRRHHAISNVTCNAIPCCPFEDASYHVGRHCATCRFLCLPQHF